jgi:organic radical activating enzyme
MVQTMGPTAALAGIPAGLQAQGIWAGRRQLFVRFAAEAETATMYTADALMNELQRSTTRSSFHSISITGRDPLANVEYLRAAFERPSTTLPIMLDCDGQRPREIEELRHVLQLVQVTVDNGSFDAAAERAFETLAVAAKGGIQHALVVNADEKMTDAHILRVVERGHATSAAVSVVIHPGDNVPVDRDRRWMTLFERVAALHSDVRLSLRLPPPTGMR